MTTTLCLGSSNDGYIACGDVSWNNALNGANANVFNGGNTLYYGAENDGVTPYWVNQAFIEFAYTRTTNHTEWAAQIGIRHNSHVGTTTQELLVMGFDWGGTVDATDWRNPLAFYFSGYPMVAQYFDPQASSTSQYCFAGSDELIHQIRGAGTSTYRYVLATNRQTTYDLNPATDEYNGFWSGESSLDPILVVTSHIKNTLTEVLGAQVQLSDGTWAVLESDGAAVAPVISLRHINASGTATTKATIPTGTADSGAFVVGTQFAWSTGQQQLALVVDASDNLYVIGWRSTTTNDIACKAYIKGAGTTWTAQTTTYGSLPAAESDPTNFAAAWHAVGTGGGTIVVLLSRQGSDAVRGIISEACFALLSCQAALAGTGTLIRTTSWAVGNFTPQISTGTWMTQTNETGTGLDVCALSSTKGVVHTFSRRDRLGVLQPTTKARYTLSSDGTYIPSVFYDVNEGSAGTWGVKTASTKLRAIPIDSETTAVLSADSDVGWGITCAVIRNSGSSTNWTLLGRVRLGNESITTMPSTSTLSESQAWDAALVTGPGKIWVYYLDTANGLRLMRTAISLSSYAATREEIQVSAAVGAVGSTNLAIRTQRLAGTPRRVLVSVANRSSGGTLSTIYLVDTPNEAPTAPTLASRPNFDAANAATFTWTFNDPDIGDTQTSYEVDINTSTGTDVYDTGQLSGTVTYVGIGAKAEGNNTSLAPALPASWQPGDLLLIAASIRNSGTGTVNTPTGWNALVTSGNFTILGRIARTGDVAPTVTFANGAVNATTVAQCAAWRGTDQNIATVLNASTSQLNASAQNIAYPTLTPTLANCAVMAVGWKQNSWTSVATAFGTEIADSSSALGSTAGLVWDYQIQTTATALTAGSFVVTGGVAAISRAIVLAIRPQQTTTASSFTLPANILTNATAYQWRARTWDQAGAAGAWSTYSTFSAGAGGTVTITDPATDNPAGVITSTYPVAWSLTGATQAQYRVIVVRSDTLAEVYNSGWVVSVATTQIVTGLVSDVQHQIQVTTRTGALVESNTGTRLITPDYDTPDLPIVTVTPMTDDGHTLVSVTNPAASGDRPDVDYNQIQRRALTGDDAGEAWMVIGAVAPNGQWRDFTAASNIVYEYRVVAVATDGNLTETAAVEGALCLQGVWIHDPIDPADVTAAHYTYGGQGKGDEVETTADGFYYAGRALPIYEFGEHESEIVDIPIQVPFGDDWVTDIADLFVIPRLRTTLCVRDARGRRVFGVVTKVTRNDQRWGTEVSFQLNRVDYDETYTGTP